MNTSNVRTLDMAWSLLAKEICSLSPRRDDDKEWLENLQILANRFQKYKMKIGYTKKIKKGDKRVNSITSNPEFIHDAEMLSDRDVAKKWHISTNSLANWRYQGRIPKKKEKDIKTMEIGKYCETHSLVDASKHFGMSYTAIQYRRQKYKDVMAERIL